MAAVSIIWKGSNGALLRIGSRGESLSKSSVWGVCKWSTCLGYVVHGEWGEAWGQGI